MRIIEIIAPSRLQERLLDLARVYNAIDVWCGAPDRDDRLSVRIVVLAQTRQGLMNALQELLDQEAEAGMVVTLFDATRPIPAPVNGKGSSGNPRDLDITREGLHAGIAKGAELNKHFVLLIVLSTVAATIGLAEDNVAVVIGSMIIAPLLGPIIALAFATAGGNRSLAQRAAVTAVVGLTLAILLSFAVGWVWPVSVTNAEVMARTQVHLASIVLALTAGAAGVMALTSGLTSTLVGVMVAVSLLPPASVFGLLLSKGRYDLADGAALLLAVNVVCVLLAANLVFLFQGVRPRRWVEGGEVAQGSRLSRLPWLLLWLLLVAVLIAVILARDGFRFV
ncbi:MAG: TIGR00341 family protein [Chromatiaceae bacterium]|nr:MAG: TIGR00341 family protein [Chromatiaceae bacterium]